MLKSRRDIFQRGRTLERRINSKFSRVAHWVSFYPKTRMRFYILNDPVSLTFNIVLSELIFERQTSSNDYWRYIMSALLICLALPYVHKTRFLLRVLR